MQHDYYVGRWHSDAGHYIAIVRRGRTRLHVCTQDHPVRVAALPLAEERHVERLDYPLRRAVRRFLAFARNGNATAGALKHLKAARDAEGAA